MSTVRSTATHIQSKPCSPQIYSRQTPLEHLLDVELPVGGQP